MLAFSSELTPMETPEIQPSRRARPAFTGLAALLLAAPLAGQQGTDVAWTMDYLQVDVTDATWVLSVELTEVTGPHADLYLRRGAKPTTERYDFASTTPGTSDEAITVTATTRPPIATDVWWVGVLRPAGTNYDISWSFDPVPSLRSGFGALPYRTSDELGTTFRVWAPFAQALYVAGDFNGWNPLAGRLAAEAGGVWSLDHRNVLPGAHYEFVVDTGSELLWKNDPRAKELVSSLGPSIVVDPDAYRWTATPYTTPAWNEMVLYELHAGTFVDAPGGEPGTFRTIERQLDYLADLGVNAIELMPIHEFPGDYSWGYNPSYPFSVEQHYGGPDGLKHLIDEAHQRGIAVLLDVLYNHWGPSDMDLWRFDGWHEGDWGGIYFYNDERAVTPWGDTRPDFGRGEVRAYIRDNALSWLHEYRVDGLRWDSTSNIRMNAWGDSPEGWSLMQWINDEIDAQQGWKIQIAEDMFNAPNDWITKGTPEGGAGFDAQWDALFVHPIRNAIVGPDDDFRNMWDVRNAVAHAYNGDAFQRVIYTESHDEVANGKSRVPEEIWPGNAGSWFSKKRSTLGAALVLTSPGIPMLFQGQELLEDGFFSDDDPVDWTKAQTYSGIRALYKDLIGMRRNKGGVTRGLTGGNTNVHHVNDFEKVVAFHRWYDGGPGDDVVVVTNFRNKAWGDYRVGLPRSGFWHVRFNSDWSGYDPTFGDHPANGVTADAIPWDGMPYSASLSFGPYTALVLSQ